MEMGVPDRIKAQLTRGKNQGGKQLGVFFKVADGDNRIRLVGDFVEVQQHFLSGSSIYKKRGVCPKEAFDVNNPAKIPTIIHCPDWNVEKQEWRKDRSCPLCAINRLAFKMRDNPRLSDAEKEEWKAAGLDCYVKPSLTWNVIDRADPSYVNVKPDGSEEKVRGYKIGTFPASKSKTGRSLCESVLNIYRLCNMDISDPDSGIDIIITKTSVGNSTNYTAMQAMDGMTVAVTPLTDEERGWPTHDLVRIGSRSTPAYLILDNMFPDLHQKLMDNWDAAEIRIDYPDDQGDAPADDPEPAPAPRPAQASRPAPAPAPRPNVPSKPAPAPRPDAVAPWDDGQDDVSTEDPPVSDAAMETESVRCLGWHKPNHPECVKCPHTEACIEETVKAGRMVTEPTPSAPKSTRPRPPTR